MPGSDVPTLDPDSFDRNSLPPRSTGSSNTRTYSSVVQQQISLPKVDVKKQSNADEAPLRDGASLDGENEINMKYEGINWYEEMAATEPITNVSAASAGTTAGQEVTKIPPLTASIMQLDPAITGEITTTEATSPALGRGASKSSGANHTPWDPWVDLGAWRTLSGATARSATDAQPMGFRFERNSPVRSDSADSKSRFVSPTPSRDLNGSWRHKSGEELSVPRTGSGHESSHRAEHTPRCSSQGHDATLDVNRFAATVTILQRPKWVDRTRPKPPLPRKRKPIPSRNAFAVLGDVADD